MSISLNIENSIFRVYHKATTEENKKHLRGGNDMTGVLIGLGVYVVVMMFAPCVYYGITG
jgi:hypothetical protein